VARLPVFGGDVAIGVMNLAEKELAIDILNEVAKGKF
jgi:hypothetical protein